MDPKLVEFLKNGATVLTPTRRLASRLLSKANALLCEHADVWQTPIILTLDDWLMALWDQFEIQGVVDTLLLNQTQSLLLFENIIEQSEKGKTLLQTHTTAKLAYEAWKILHSWEATHLLEKEPENIDEATFQEWAKFYQAWLSEHHCIDGAQLISSCLTVLTTTANSITLVSPEKKIVLYGFEEHSPLLNTFFDTLEAIDWEIFNLQPLKLNPLTLYRQGFMNEEEECKAAANWAKTLLQQNKRDIAIVTPHLTKQRHKIEMIFRDCLNALMICDSVLEINRDFNISAAIPLNQYPIIQGAFEFLRINQAQCLLTDYLAALTSPFSSQCQAEVFARSKLSGELKQLPPSKWSIDKSLSSLSMVDEAKIIHWKQILVGLKNITSGLSGKKTLLQWSEIFREILNIAGWPGERALSSIEHQAVKRWDELLNELIFCDVVLEGMYYHDALQTLEKLSANIPFQAENKNAAIQLLGLLEAAGQHFEHLWIMGLYSEAWPENAQPNPFIPIQFQRKLTMPHASPEREMLYAKKVTQRLKESALEVIFSYPMQDKEKVLQVSELIADLPLKEIHHNADLGKFGAQNLFVTKSLEKYHDEVAPIVDMAEKITGNANLLSLQAACPFKAFAQVRLDLKPIEPRQIWLSPREQGTILHQILERFWGRIKESTALLKLSSEELETLLNQLINESLQKLTVDAPSTYIEVEKTRLKLILLDYITLEKQRKPFKTVALESKQQFTLGELTFNMRIDRIDEIENGTTVIIDYKTGQFQVNQLWGQRPQAPQLPLYYIALQCTPKALMITKLNSKSCEFVGISEEAELIDGLTTLDKIKSESAPFNWSELSSYWRNNLEDLVYAFQRGQAQVDPLQGKLTCEYCHLSSLCRIQEIRIQENQTHEIRVENE